MNCYMEYYLNIDDKVISYNTMIFTEEKYFNFLKPNYSFDIKETEDKFLIIITSDLFAKCVEVKINNYEGNLSDNYFDLSPMVKKNIEIYKEFLSKDITFGTLKDNLIVRSIVDLY